MPLRDFDIQRGQEVGHNLATTNPLGIFAKGILDRVNQMQGMRMQEESTLRLERAKIALDPEKRLFSALTGQLTGQPGQTETGLPSGFQMSKINAGPFTFENPQLEGQVAAEKESQTRLEKLKDAIPLLQTFEQRLNELPAPQSAAERVVQAPGMFLGAKAQTNPKLAAFESFRTGLRSQVARILGEVGNLSETEQRYAINLLPSQYDTQDTRTQKLDNFYDFISQRVASRTGTSPEQALSMLRPSTQSVPLSPFESQTTLPAGFRRR